MVGRIALFSGLPGQFHDQCRRKSDACRLATETSTKVAEWSASRLMNRIGTHLMACRLHGLEILKHAIKL